MWSNFKSTWIVVQEQTWWPGRRDMLPTLIMSWTRRHGGTSSTSKSYKLTIDLWLKNKWRTWNVKKKNSKSRFRKQKRGSMRSSAILATSRIMAKIQVQGETTCIVASARETSTEVETVAQTQPTSSHTTTRCSNSFSSSNKHSTLHSLSRTLAMV